MCLSVCLCVCLSVSLSLFYRLDFVRPYCVIFCSLHWTISLDFFYCSQENTGTTAPSLLHPIESRSALPTYNRTNKFTYGFQVIIDAYGVATYKEINPGITILQFYSTMIECCCRSVMCNPSNIYFMRGCLFLQFLRSVCSEVSCFLCIVPLCQFDFSLDVTCCVSFFF